MEDLLSIKPREVAEVINVSMYPKDYAKLKKFCDFLTSKNEGGVVSEEDVVKNLLKALDNLQEFADFNESPKRGRKKKSELS